MNNTRKHSWLFLQRHADGGEGAGSAPAGEAAVGSTSAVTEQSVAQGGTVASQQSEPSFDEMLKTNPAFKAAYDERVNAAIQNRFKKANATEERLKATAPLVEKLAAKYGIAPSETGEYDLNAISAAADKDDSYYEQEALEKGLSVEDLKHIKSLERENAEFRANAAAAKKQEQERQLYNALVSGAQATKAMYPNFDLDTEMKNPTFARMVMTAGVPVQTAFEVVHKDEIMPAAMRFAANKASAQVAQSVAANKSRPTENGGRNGLPADTAINPASLTAEQRRDMIERAKRGEKISL